MTDADHMAHALRLGARGQGRVWPNPAVGCVIVAGDRIVGRGWTQPGGRPHAEAMALAQAGEAARGATAFVTLEPCAHQGRAGPCTDALITAGVARVVTAMTDPDPRTVGQGHARLRAAGIAVTEGVLADTAARAHAGFVKRVTQGLPFVTLKLAASIDGHAAMASGESRWITGPAARRAVHAMRLAHDAVLVGAGTLTADDPDLTARDIGATHQPVRVVLSGRLPILPDSRLARTAGQVPVWMLTGADAPDAHRRFWQEAGAQVAVLPDLQAVTALRHLATLGITRVLCEGGPRLAASLIAAGVVDDLVLFHGGVVIGGDGQPIIGALPHPTLAAAPRAVLRAVTPLGPDTLTRWSLA